MSEGERGGPSRALVIAAFAAVYLIWGSTYLAIRFGLETLPPFLLGAARFLVAGAILYGWARWRGAARPSRAEWGAAAWIGALLLLVGNGAVVWAEQRVASGVAALLVATVPFWMVVVEAVRPGGVRPNRRVKVGLVVGLFGLALLTGPGQLVGGGGGVDLVGAAVLLVGSLGWSIGSVYSRHARLPSSPLLATGMQMLVSGACFLVISGLAGELAGLRVEAISLRSILGLAYLIVFGSLVGFTAYGWLLRVSTPARVSTYAYVNPVVAVLLGWLLGGEPLTARIVLAMVIILGSVALINTARATSEGSVEVGGGEPRRRVRPRAALRRAGRLGRPRRRRARCVD
ncbi:MAG TPA: drug/metabolite exporter YedA [Longimicrobiales bacterium]